MTEELNHFEAIRLLSGMFEDDKEKMQTRLYLCCLLARHALGDAEDKFVHDQMEKCGIKLKRSENAS